MSSDLLNWVQISVLNPVALFSFIFYFFLPGRIQVHNTEHQKKGKWTGPRNIRKINIGHFSTFVTTKLKNILYSCGWKCLMSQITHGYINLAFSELRKMAFLKLTYDPHREGSLCFMLVSMGRSIPLIN